MRLCATVIGFVVQLGVCNGHLIKKGSVGQPRQQRNRTKNVSYGRKEWTIKYACSFAIKAYGSAFLKQSTEVRSHSNGAHVCVCLLVFVMCRVNVASFRHIKLNTNVLYCVLTGPKRLRRRHALISTAISFWVSRGSRLDVCQMPAGHFYREFISSINSS